MSPVSVPFPWMNVPPPATRMSPSLAIVPPSLSIVANVPELPVVVSCEFGAIATTPSFVSVTAPWRASVPPLIEIFPEAALSRLPAKLRLRPGSEIKPLFVSVPLFGIVSVGPWKPVSVPLFVSDPMVEMFPSRTIV